MNCEEIDKHLTEYFDKSLDMAMTTRVATHVISCAHCRAESNELADCIEQVASLPAMEPPLGFAQRVMAHVRDSQPRPSLWQRLIAPLTGRVPLPATALAMVAIVALVLYQKEPALKPEALKPGAQAPTRENPLPVPSGGRQTSIMDQETVVPAKSPADSAKISATEKSPHAASSSPAQRRQLQTVSPTPLRTEIDSAVEVKEEKREVSRRPPLRVQEVTTARDLGPMLGDPRGFSAPLPSSLAAMRQATPRAPPMALDRSIPLGDRVADFEFVVRRRPPQRSDAIEQPGGTEALQKSNDAEPLAGGASRPAGPTAGRARIESIAEIRFYSVAPEHFEIFKKELAVEAIVEAEPKVGAREIDSAKQADRQLLVKVTILPADHATPPSR